MECIKGARVWNKDELQKMAEELYKEAFDANAYYLIMKQYRENLEKYESEVQLSPAFYQIVFNALQNACFMEFAKLYDKSKGVFSVGLLIKESQENLPLFPEYRLIIEDEIDGQKYTSQIPYQHELRPEEECFFKDQVKSQREILQLFDTPSTDTSPVTINLKFSELLDLYYKRFCSLSKKQENLRVQRNKIYAHNDIDKLSDIDKVLKKNPIFYADIQELIDFALDVTRLVIGCLTGVYQPDKYANIDDWKNTMRIAELGLKYQEYDTEQKMKECQEQIRFQEE